MKSVLLSLCILASCGGGSSKPASTPAPVDPVPMNEGSAAAPAAAEPLAPSEPVAPSEPAPPVAPDPAKVRADLLAVEMAAYERAKPVFEKWCASCHSKDGKKQSAKKRDHFDTTTYPFGGHHAMEISGEIREVLGLTGKKPTMPPNRKGAVQGDELEAIEAWADAFDASHRGGARAHDEHVDHGGKHKH